MEELNTPSAQNNENTSTSSFHFFPFFNHKQSSFFLFFIAILFYAPSINNEYALDDGIIIHQNEFALKGIRGIKGILSKDLYDSFYRRMNAEDQLQGGRYRPLSVISYAIEQELIGTYRSGYYMRTIDANNNGTLDGEEVEYTNENGNTENNFEYNNYVDINGDGIAQPNECYYCWDLNKNFKNDPSEDLNKDGVFNEIDCQVYGAGLRHFNNILFYALACVILYLLFTKHWFKNKPDLAFLAALIFVVHPVHSEVVANVRGRDDIFSLIFISLTFMYAFKFFESRSTKTLILSSVFLLLALLSKEYAALLLIFIPLSLFVFEKINLNWRNNMLPLLIFLLTAIAMTLMDANSIYFTLPDWLVFGTITLLYVFLTIFIFRNYFKERRVGALMIAYYSIGICYLALRLNAVKMSPGVADTEILNNPYLLATGAEAFATKIYTLLVDLKLMFLPHPLISDYSYSSILYRQLNDWDFLLSFFIHITVLVIGIVFTLKRHILGFAILFYFAFIVVVSNLLIPTGTVMIESYLFHASIGIAIFIAWAIITLLKKLNTSMVTNRTLINSLMIVLVILAGMKAWERSKDWKNDVTLFLKDVKNQPNSVLILGNAGARWIDLADTREITGIISPGEDSTRFNDYNGTLVITDQEIAESGYATKREAALGKGIAFLEHAVELHPRYVNGYLNLGLAYFKLQNEIAAIQNWKYAELLYPNNPYLSNYYYVFSSILKERGNKDFQENKFSKALESYQKWTIIQPKDADAWYNLGGAYFNLHNTVLAKKSWEKALVINPNHTQAKNALDMVQGKKLY